MCPDSNAVFLANFHNSLRQCGKLISTLSRNSQNFAAAERKNLGGDAGESAPTLNDVATHTIDTKLADVEAMVKSVKKKKNGAKATAKPPLSKGAMGRRRELAEQLDGAEAAILQDLKIVREYSRAMDTLEQKLKQPNVAKDAVQFTLLQGSLNELRVKYDNAQAAVKRSRAEAADLQKACEECPDDIVLEKSMGRGIPTRGPDKGTQRALTMAANAVANLADMLTPR